MSVIIGSVVESLPSYLAQNEFSKILVLVDQNTKKSCYASLKALLPTHKLVVIKSGENHKNLETCTTIWQAMTDYQMDRHSLLLNLGGGVIGDMGGFCAATYKRGIRFIQLPTTLLSQVDASVGGKLGIDFQGFKNHIGVFQLPDAVLIDPQFLKTLPAAELRSGFAEIIKHCLIQDATQWENIRKKDLEEQNLEELIAHSVAIKQQVVAEDPTEKGLRKILNFGHTLGHAIETHFLDNPSKKLLHGEAVAAGMIAEAYLSFKLKMIDESTLLQIEEYIFAVYGKCQLTAEDLPAVLALTLQDKKNKGGQVRFSLLNAAGSCTYDVICNTRLMKEALLYYIG